MKAFLLAAGEGTRLKPLTDDLPKCLVQVNGKPLLDHWISEFRMNGIRDIFINVHHFSEKILEHIGKTKFEDVRITISYERELLGSAGTLFKNRSYVRGETNFIIAYADVWTTTNLKQMVSFHMRRPAMATIGLYEPDNIGECGIVKIDRGNVVKFEEKPQNPKGRYAFTGLAVVERNALENLTPASFDIGKDFLPTLVGRMSAYIIHDPLFDIGTPEGYEKAQEAAKQLGLRVI